MSFAAPFAFALGTLAIAVIVLYILKVKRRRVVVPYLQLWESLVVETRAITIFKRLRRLLSLLLQLAILAALVLAVARPSFGTDGASGKSIVLVLDASASLGARESGGRTRFDLLREEARRLVDARGADDEWMVVAASDRVDVLCPFTRSTLRLRAAVERAALTHRSLDVPQTLAFAREVTRGRKSPLHVYLTDGNGGVLTRALEGDGTARIVPVGNARENVGIVRFSVRKNPSLGTDYVLATVKNYGDEARDFTMEFDVNGVTQKVLPKSLPAGAEATESFQLRLPEGGALRLRLGFDAASTGAEPGRAAQIRDGLEIDDTAHAIAAPERLRRILLVTATPEDAAPFQIAFRAMREVVDESSATVTASEYGNLTDEERHADVTICLDVLPDDLDARGNQILIHTPIPRFLPASIAGEDPTPVILDWDREHVLNRFLNYREVRLPPAHVVKLTSGAKIVDGGEGALVAAFETPTQRTLYVAFDMTSQLFPFRLAFPMLLRNAIAWFEAEEDQMLEETYAPGATISPLRRLTVPSVSARFVRGGLEQVRELPVDQGRFYFSETDEPGPIVFRIGDREYGTVVNLFDRNESAIGLDRAPPKDTYEPGSRFRFGSGEPWTTFALAALLLWALEWILYHRRVTE